MKVKLVLWRGFLFYIPKSSEVVRLRGPKEKSAGIQALGVLLLGEKWQPVEM